MLKIEFTSKMKRDVKRMQKRGCSLAKLEEVLNLLVERNPLPLKNRDHQLKGGKKDFRECHIEPDWLLIYKVSEDRLILSAIRTGTHSDLLDM
ncbi:MAG: type II toxin-antitoxin system YafQ family toxin [Lactobacillales bacterium]|jgi:mRNA interferase YafQ|nr:type II toxin-antitoxin system YafQ family toxin [Lactobacillales bacterium]